MFPQQLATRAIIFRACAIHFQCTFALLSSAEDSSLNRSAQQVQNTNNVLAKMYTTLTSLGKFSKQKSIANKNRYL